MALPGSLNMVLAPKVFERSGTQLRISGRVPNVGVTEPILLDC